MRYLTKDLTRPEAAGAAASAAGARPAAAASAPGTISTRQDAIETLRRVRDYFRKSEPHSPLSYVIDQGIRWSQMPLHQLVNELIPDPSALASFQMRTGVQAQSTEPTNQA
jgi:type VI secretion system protein ImpA